MFASSHRRSDRPQQNHCRRRRAGYAAMLAMLFLVLFSTLAVGFYSSTSTAIVTADNDRRIALAQQSAESGMDFMRYQLAHVAIPPNTPSDQVVTELATQLAANLNGTHNMGSDVVGITGNVIYIPFNTSHSLSLDPAGQQRFAITITAWGSDIVVKSTGTLVTAAGNPISRSISMDFTAKAVPTSSFEFAVASRGQIMISKGSITATSGVDPTITALMSDQATAGAITMSGGSVGGDLNILAGATANVTAGSVDGVTNLAMIQAQHVHIVGDPEFPIVDTSVYVPYAVNAYTAGAPVQQNIVVPAGTNPQFSGGDEVDGIMYVKSPNTITFRGNFKLKGFIVFENAGSSVLNKMDFRGSIIVSPLPPDPAFDAMRSVSGVAILAPTTAMSMSGSSDSTIRGNLLVGSFSYSGASNVYIDHGTVMTFNTGANSAVFNTTKSILFTATGETNQPSAGLVYPSYFAPKPSTYQEILP
jgi:hypothetical protein